MLGEQEQQRRQRSQRKRDVLAIFLVLSGLYWFAASFFLAKRSLSSFHSDCHEAELLLQEQLGLSPAETQKLIPDILANPHQRIRQGCWMDRRVDSMVILLVDALRFDFAYYNLPLSVGKRLKAAQQQAETSRSSSKLFQFVADPPTVTMQRLKALTTGGLPTFADISANFGGATVEDDSWIHQLQIHVNNTSSSNLLNWQSRGLQSPAKAGFVGDDTWEDLFPHHFHPSYPYPSFNTRDLDTVDNGCLKHIPEMLQHLAGVSSTNNKKDDELEVMVVHFLGVDHVGHTYGPHNEHMDAKLKQIDAALQTVLELLDESSNCHTALIFGDHGMTEDGNHGGGTLEETNAALFVHSSPACGKDNNNNIASSRDAAVDIANYNFYHNLEKQTTSDWVVSSSSEEETTFASIHQIDLVPTISLLLGLPIPYANLGGLVPSLLAMPYGGGVSSVRQMTAALALNAAQLWRYYTVYSRTANRLPNLSQLHDRLMLAVSEYQQALASDVDDVDKYLQAATLFKVFLTEGLELGQRVWTRFDGTGMVCGIVVLAIGLFVYVLPLFGGLSSSPRDCRHMLLSSLPQYWEVLLALVFMIYQCGVLTFSNSYILEEEHSIMFCLSILSIMVGLRLFSDPGSSSTLWRGLILLPVASRLNELFVSGHGLDPSIRLHAAHHAIVFLLSLATLGAFRWFLYQKRITPSAVHAMADCVAIFCLAWSWYEKRDLDPERNGYFPCRIALILIFGGIPISIVEAMVRPKDSEEDESSLTRRVRADVLTLLAKVLIAIMAVTGPSTATSLLLYTFQIVIVYSLAATSGPLKMNSLVLAAMLRMVTRHVFFATNHGCAFNRLQYSAAFVATEEFYFVTGGISLFLNTFGWEMAGIVFAWLCSQHSDRTKLWRIYGALQVLEALTSCISVSLLRRHLMVWDIYAPHFLFAAIFTVLNLLSQLTALLLTELPR